MAERVSGISSNVPNFNRCEDDLAREYGTEAVAEFIGQLARAAVTVDEERTIYAVGACLLTEPPAYVRGNPV